MTARHFLAVFRNWMNTCFTKRAKMHGGKYPRRL